jgi:hypothetical protein
MSDPPSDSPAELDGALRAVEADNPGWHAWNGSIPMLYARWMLSSPPVVVRAPDIPGLRAEIDKARESRRP